MSSKVLNAKPNDWSAYPDAQGRFGDFGGRYVAETLMPLVLELDRAYTEAKNAMFQVTDIDEAHWTVIKSNDKKRARLNAIRYVLHRMPYTGKDVHELGLLDPLVVGRASDVYEIGESSRAEV